MFLFLFLMSNLVAYVACIFCVMFCICHFHPVIGAGLELLLIAMLRFFLMTILPFKFNVAFIMCMVILLYGVNSSCTVHRAMAVRLIENPAVTVSCDMCLKLYNISTCALRVLMLLINCLWWSMLRKD